MFSKKEAIKFGWSIAKRYFWLFLLVLLTSFFLQVIPNVLKSAVGKNQPIVLILFLTLISVLAGIVKLITDLGIIKIALKFADNQIAVFKDLFGSYGYFWKYLGGFILYSLIVVGGFLLLIIPGIIWTIRFQYYSYFIVDKGLGPIESLKQSWRITRGSVWNLWFFGLVLGLLNIGGALLLLVGLFLTVPTTMIASAYVFRKLQGAAPV